MNSPLPSAAQLEKQHEEKVVAEGKTKDSSQKSETIAPILADLIDHYKKRGKRRSKARRARSEKQRFKKKREKIILDESTKEEKNLKHRERMKKFYSEKGLAAQGSKDSSLSNKTQSLSKRFENVSLQRHDHSLFDSAKQMKKYNTKVVNRK